MKAKAVRNVESYSLLFEDDRAPMYELFWDQQMPDRITVYIFGKEAEVIQLSRKDANRASAKVMGTFVLDKIVEQHLKEAADGL